MVDVVYIAACSHDTRMARICLASVRHFYPDVPLRLLAGGKLDADFVREARRYWGADVAPLPGGNYGWGFVKLEPLFGRAGERFFILDSDTVLTGPVLDADDGAHFLIDNEATAADNVKQLYYDWEKVRRLDAKAQAPKFVFNSGQWIGTAGALKRDDFSPWIEWTMPRRLRHPEMFMPGDQGVLNYVINQKAAQNAVSVERRQLMRWPGNGMAGLEAEAVAAGSAPALVVHWAGMKDAVLGRMAGADLLVYFEKEYFSRLPGGETRRRLNACADQLYQRRRALMVWTRLAYEYKLKRKPGTKK